MRFKLLLVYSLPLAIVLCLQGCASVQRISPESIEAKVAQVKVGVTNRSEAEAIFGAGHDSDGQHWFYNLSDSAMELAERKTGMFSGALPIAPNAVATNTRAVITFTFDARGTVSAFEVARFFDPPLKNDYWYLVKEEAGDIFEKIVKAGEASELRIDQMDKSSGTLALVDQSSNARVIVELTGHTLHVSSQNPADRLTTEYRAFTKRERAFTRNISAAQFVQQ